MAIRRRCGQRAPEILVGSLGPLHCSKEVSKYGWHEGDHKAFLVKAGIGRTTVAWKQGPEYQPKRQPPVVELPRAIASELEHTRCACPEWWKNQGAKYHRAPCRIGVAS